MWAVEFGSVGICAMEEARDGNDTSISGTFASSGSRDAAKMFGRRRPAGGQGGGDAVYNNRDASPGGRRCCQLGSVRTAVGGKRHGATALSSLRLRGATCQAAQTHGANPTRLGSATERARVLLPRLSPGFFSLGPKF